MNILDLNGSHYEIGYKLGVTLKEDIRYSLDKPINNHDEKITEISSRQIRYLRNCYKIISDQLPDISEEIRGLSEGASIPLEAALSLQYKRELLYPRIDHASECTVFSTSKLGSKLILAQNVDVAPHMEKICCLNLIESSKNPRGKCLIFTFSGMLGFAGMNNHGLAIAINYLSSSDWQEGISPYLLIRHFLTCSSINECLQEVGRLKRSSSRCITIAQDQVSIAVEMTATKHRIISMNEYAHTNHFIHDELTNYDSLHPFSKNSSLIRLQDCLYQLKSIRGSSYMDAFQILSSHGSFPIGICAHSDSTREKTVASLIMQPSTNQMAYRLGNPCSSETYELTIE